MSKMQAVRFPAGWSTWFHACDNLLVEDVKGLT